MVGGATPGNPYGHGVRETVPHRGLPPGGDAGYHLAKKTDQSYDVEWVNPFDDVTDDWQHRYDHRPIPLGYLLSAGANNSATAGRNKNEVGWFAAGAYPFHSDYWANSQYSDGKWVTWLDLDTDVGRYIRELGDDLIGATIVAYATHKVGSWFYAGPQRARIDAVSMTTISNGLLQVTFTAHDETDEEQWTKPEAHTSWSLPFSDIHASEGRTVATNWLQYEEGSPPENLLWFIERQTDALTRADAAGWYQVFRQLPHRMRRPGGVPTFKWPDTYYNHNLMQWQCKVGGSSGTYGDFTLSVNPYGTGTTLYCPTGSKFFFVWSTTSKGTEFGEGYIKVSGSTVTRAADLLTVAKTSRDAEDFRQKLIAHLEKIVASDEAEAKAAAALEENPPAAADEQIAPPAEKPKRKRRAKADD